MPPTFPSLRRDCDFCKVPAADLASARLALQPSFINGPKVAASMPKETRLTATLATRPKPETADMTRPSRRKSAPSTTP